MRFFSVKAALRMLALLYFSYGVTSGALSSGLVKVEPINGSKKAKISIEHNPDSRYQIEVENLSGNLNYHSEAISNDGKYTKIYDFSKLSDGSYKLLLKGENFYDETIIKIQNGALVIPETTGSDKIEPFFKLENNKLLISYLNLYEAPVKVCFKTDDEEIFSDVDPDATVDYSRKFDVSKLNRGQYAVMLTAGDKAFHYNFVVR